MAEKHWIAGAIKHPGAFKAKAQKAGKTTKEFAAQHLHDKGTLGKQARLAYTLMGMHGSGHTAEKDAKKPKKSLGESLYGKD